MKVELTLPIEFIDLCKESGITPERLLYGFIGDLCSLQHQDNPDLNNHGSDERAAARAWLARAECMMAGRE